MSLVNQFAFVGKGMLLIMAAVLGAMAFAAERRDSSDEFLSVLPPSRLQVLTSKLLLSTVCLCVIIFIAFASTAIGSVIRFGLPTDSLWVWQVDLRGFVDFHAVNVLFTFGIAWLLSTVSRSVSICAIAAAVISYAVVYLFHDWLFFRLMSEAERISISRLWGDALLSCGVLGLLVGSIIQWRRVK
jgi:ABC-type transport system involved in multi-copper enzyme maturation permease subunit